MDDAEAEPFNFGFFLGGPSEVFALPPASFKTIFACISSNLAAFTFFGQNRVTKL
jgi:hypothetical protein